MTTTTNNPYSIDIEQGKFYAWCSCGLSEDAPLCDGTHRNKSDKRPVKFIAQTSQTAQLCGCTLTQTPPYCDGSHGKAD
jgi:CDGSH-type Zn-finger protein